MQSTERSDSIILGTLAYFRHFKFVWLLKKAAASGAIQSRMLWTRIYTDESASYKNRLIDIVNNKTCIILLDCSKYVSVGTGKFQHLFRQFRG